ncbi:hypothetical protein BTVI_39459 [Pitangus sulphuratus]|nr:hypothetical protein BTVI_39459 [Pitangus sulphuratus]
MDLGVLVGKKMNLSQHCALAAQKANHILGCTQRSVGSRSRKVTLFFHSTLVRSHLEYRTWGPQHWKETDLLDQAQSRAEKMIRGLKHLIYEDRLREMALFILEKRRLWDHLIAAFQYLKGA